MKAMKRPIPAVTAYFKFIGIASTTASLTLNNDKSINIIPSTKTAVRATSQEIPIPITTEKVKNAFNPIPGASPKGNLA